MTEALRLDKVNMATISQPSLFGWKDIEASSDLNRLQLVLSTLPDSAIVNAIEKRRGRGRDDYPVRPTWNTLIAGIVYNHPNIATLRRELLRNGELRQICGFDPLLGDAAVPSEDAFSRFVASVIDQEPRIDDMFHELVHALNDKLPDLGRRLAVDSKAIPSFGNDIDRDKRKGANDGRRDNDADWGVKTSRGKREDGTAWEKMKSWFGYKLHLLVDSDYEIPLAFRITEASASDMTNLLPLVDDLQDHHSKIADDADELSADRGYDSALNNKEIYDAFAIKPIIDNRLLWKGELGSVRILYPDRVDVLLYDEKGCVYCQCPSERRGEDEVRELAFVGFEKDRAMLKYRCPAAYYELGCPGRATCEAGLNVGSYGRVVRIPLSRDRRIFTPVARSSQKWKKAYRRRTSVERVNSRIDALLGFDRHTIRGKEKMKMRMGLALTVMLAMALGRIRAGQADQMRSMTAPVRRTG